MQRIHIRTTLCWISNPEMDSPSLASGECEFLRPLAFFISLSSKVGLRPFDADTRGTRATADQSVKKEILLKALNYLLPPKMGRNE
jgi:hypothetical protein